MSDDTPTPPKRKRVSKVDMSDMGPMPPKRNDPEGFKVWRREYKRRLHHCNKKQNQQRRISKIDMSDVGPCPHGTKDPEGKKAWKREYSRRYYIANRERVLERASDYWRDNKERISEKSRVRCNKYYRKNRDRLVEQKRTYYKNNRKEVLGRNLLWQKRNPKRVTEIKRNYWHRNPHMRAKNRRDRRAKERNAFIPLTQQERKQMNALEVHRQILTETTGIEHHLDHIIPLTKGGIHHPINLRVITWEENVSKGDKLIPEAMPLIPLIEELRKERQRWLNNEQGNLRDLFNHETETDT